MARIVSNLSEISESYDALFVDLWGCVHNGIKAFPDAIAALRAYRKTGGAVVLVTNAPRGWHSVRKQLTRFELPEDTWDAIATSGDSARSAMFQGAVGEKVYFIGQPHDQSFFDRMELIKDPTTIAQVPLADADGIVCCGPFDPMADPDVNRADFLVAKQKGMKLLCANPDIVVDRGETREWCAGALAKLFTQMGGESLYFGNPHPPIYDLARRRLAAAGFDVEPHRILAIGDGVLTDIRGAMGEDIDSLLITGGLAAAETSTKTAPNPEKLETYLQREEVNPTFAIGVLR